MPDCKRRVGGHIVVTRLRWRAGVGVGWWPTIVCLPCDTKIDCACWKYNLQLVHCGVWGLLLAPPPRSQLSSCPYFPVSPPLGQDFGSLTVRVILQTSRDCTLLINETNELLLILRPVFWQKCQITKLTFFILFKWQTDKWACRSIWVRSFWWKLSCSTSLYELNYKFLTIIYI